MTDESAVNEADCVIAGQPEKSTAKTEELSIGATITNGTMEIFACPMVRRLPEPAASCCSWEIRM